jgi:hypothetical protein
VLASEATFFSSFLTLADVTSSTSSSFLRSD